jgi:hypothetical protein
MKPEVKTQNYARLVLVAPAGPFVNGSPQRIHPGLQGLLTVMLSAPKHLALIFLGGKVHSKILRSAQNDSLGDECTHVTLSSAIAPLKATK